ncbi:MAG: 2-iminoacetate synthase ThiH [Desulfobulbaceae bacterium]|nr:2-iminoacetate synthase ThiH [Desulfobulbaceae bacterium]
MDAFLLPDFSKLTALISSRDKADVLRALRGENLSTNDLASLLSPAAEAYLPEMAARSRSITQQRFGRVIQIYAPLYLSSYCTNQCLYCGFSAENKIHRRCLSLEEVEAEADTLKKRGVSHLLLVSGEAPKMMGVDFIEQVALRLKDRFAALSIEIQPLTRPEYARLFAAGITSVAVYQETYDPILYKKMHPAGKKSDYTYRLETPARAAAAGMREVGIGALLGLGDWRTEGLALALHLAWLRKHFWRTGVTVSFPRIRPAEGGFQALSPVSERNLTQLIFALRLFDHNVGLLLSTREEARYRNGMLGLGPTRYSAGSCTAPGGYAHEDASAEQFAVDDHRSIAEVCLAIQNQGFDPVRKDWDSCFQKN